MDAPPPNGLVKNELKGEGGSEQKGGGSSVFGPLVKSGSFNFQLSRGVDRVGHPVF